MGEEGIEQTGDSKREILHTRHFALDDAARLGEIFYRSVRHGALRAYSRSQVEAWAPFPPPADLYERKSRDGRVIWVTVDAGDRPIAYGDLEPNGHIDHLFCMPEMIGRGAASMLYDRLEEQAQTWGLERLFVEASELARPFFERKGYSTLERNDFILRGALLHNYRMEKQLVGER